MFAWCSISVLLCAYRNGSISTICPLQELKAAVSLDRFEESYPFDLAQAMLVRQNFGGAIETLLAAKKVFARSAQLELALGVAYYGQRRFPDAVDAFLRTIEIAPDVEQPYVFLSRMLDQAGDRVPEVAERFAAFDKANPDGYLGSFLHAKGLIAMRGDADQAEKLLRRSITARGDYAEAHFELGSLLERKRKWVEAEIEFARCVELNPKSSTPHYHLARIYDRLGMRDKAAAEHAVHRRLEEEERGGMSGIK
jgi:tetratricopeptide (TPR) repeat protein